MVVRNKLIVALSQCVVVCWGYRRAAFLADKASFGL
jgi:hypothetical protein